MDQKGPHVLVLGGKPRNIPEGKFLCSWEQIDSDEAERREPSMKKLPSIILCFRDFIGHPPSLRFKEKAERMGIPFVQASGGINALIEAAKQRGFDLTQWVKPNGEHKEEPDKEAPAPTPAPQKYTLPEDVKVWLSKIPPTAVEIEVSKGRKILIAKVKNKKTSLVLKGLGLEMALGEVRRRGLDKKRLSAGQGELVARYLEDELDLHERGISVEGSSIARVSNFVHGFLTERERLEVVDHKRVLKERQKARAERLASLPEKPASEPSAPQPPAQAVLPVPRGPKEEAFLTHLAHVDEMEKKLVELYDKVLSLTSENAAFVEQIERLEAAVKTKDEELKKAADELKKWKEIAAK